MRFAHWLRQQQIERNEMKSRWNRQKILFSFAAATSRFDFISFCSRISFALSVVFFYFCLHSKRDHVKNEIYTNLIVILCTRRKSLFGEEMTMHARLRISTLGASILIFFTADFLANPMSFDGIENCSRNRVGPITRINIYSTHLNRNCEVTTQSSLTDWSDA